MIKYLIIFVAFIYVLVSLVGYGVAVTGLYQLLFMEAGYSVLQDHGFVIVSFVWSFITSAVAASLLRELNEIIKEEISL